MLISGLVVLLFLSIMVLVDREILAQFETRGLRSACLTGYFCDGDFVLSAAPGFHDDEFYLTVAVPSMPRATIYWTIDGTIPAGGGENRFITRGDNEIQVSGRLDASGQIFVADRTSHWRDAILMSHSEEWVWNNHRPENVNGAILPVDDARILQGTAFRFKAFVGDTPVTETMTATYIVEPNATIRFNSVPIVTVTAPYEDFLHFYGSMEDWNYRARLIFNYEYFTSHEGRYTRQYSLLGSSNLGGQWSRAKEQRTMNVNFARGDLDGVVTYSIFKNIERLYRMRLWNGGNSFRRHHMADNFAQKASSELKVLFSDSQLAVKFINGEFWGFSSIREHTSNEDFVSPHTGIDKGNILIIDRLRSDVILEGDENIGQLFLEELTTFATQTDMSTDEAREWLFDKLFDQESFMDYLIANTFFHNSDWPHNNVRMFRAVNPNLSSSNKYNDGKWRFILHDMDDVPGWGANPSDSNFSTLYLAEGTNSHFQIFNNPTFVREFVDRAHYVVEHYFYAERLLALHNEFLEVYRPLLVDMYERFNTYGTVQATITAFEWHTRRLEEFLIIREYYYRQQLDYLLERVGLEQ